MLLYIVWVLSSRLSVYSTHLYSDIEKIQSGIGDKVAVFLSYFSTFIAGYVIAFVYSWKMALVVMTMLPLIFFVAAAFSKVRLNQSANWSMY